MIFKVSKDFSRFLGGRYIKSGPWSAELFRNDYLFPKLQEAIKQNTTLTVDLDGCYGFAASSLEEAFGGLIRVCDVSLDVIQKHMILISNEELEYIEEINRFMQDAWNHKTHCTQNGTQGENQ